MCAERDKPAHTSVATLVSWPSGSDPLGTPAPASAPAERQRRNVLRIRVTAAERQRILGRVPAGRQFSDWARCLLGTATGDDVAVKRRELIHQVARIGNNLNQVARAMHRCALTDRAVSALAVAAELRGIREALDALLP